ncbi:hypothetical protein PENSPDRAFT_618500, partial [Peniophora sp. CONT]
MRKYQQSAEVPSKRWDSLIDELSHCNNVDDVFQTIDIPEQKLKSFSAGNSQWTNVRNKYIKPAIQVLLLFNDAIAEFASHFPTVPGGKAIFVAFGVLLQATSGVSERCDMLTGLFEQLNSFLARLSIRLSTPSTLGPTSKTIIITILAHLLDIFLMATKLFSRPAWRIRLELFRQALTKDKEMGAALDRLRILTDLELRAVSAEAQVTVVNAYATGIETRAAVSELQVVAAEMVSDISRMYQDLLKATRSEQRRRTKIDASRILEKLERVEAADINAQNSNGCLKGTRVEILNGLSAWSRDKSAPQIYWLNGMAGIGKSAIARSFCHNLRHDGLLGGSFFCSRRRSAEEGDASRILSTLSISLALRDSDYNEELIAELEKEPFSKHWNLDIQIQRLLHNPFAHMRSSTDSLPIFVIDALDECSDENITRDLLLKLVAVVRCLPVKFFLTSRPEPHIRQRLEHIDAAIGKTLRLHDIERDIVEADIRLYLTHGLREMRPPSFPDWPSEADIATLTRLSGRLFIYAFTAMTYVRRNPVERLAKITAGIIATSGRALTLPLDEIYSLILSEATNAKEFDEDEVDLTRRMLSIIVSLRDPLTVVALAGLLNTPVHSVKASLNGLYAVIYVPARDDHGYLSTFHASFGDFLTTPNRAPQCMHQYMRDGQTHLSNACIRILSQKLIFNASGAVTSYLPNTKQEFTLKDDALIYACIHWSSHALACHDDTASIWVKFEEIFLGPAFLFWLELLSAKELLQMADDILLLILEGEPAASKRFREFAQDARTFIQTFTVPISHSVPHIYLSALALCPESSSVYRCCSPHFRNLARLTSQEPDLPVDFTTLFNPRHSTFSFDGQEVIMGCPDRYIRFWGVVSGRRLGRLPEANLFPVTSLMLPPYGSHGDRPVYGSSDGYLYIWDSKRNVFKGAYDSSNDSRVRGSIVSLAFSSDGHYIASGCDIGTICLHNAEPGAEFLKLAFKYYYASSVSCVSFGLSDCQLLSGFRDGTVILWSTETGRSIREPMRGHGTRAILSVVFSPDGKQMMSGADDGIVCIWDGQTSELL